MFRTTTTSKERAVSLIVGTAALAMLATACSSSGSSTSGSSAPAGDSSAAATGTASTYKADTSECNDPDAAKKKVTGTWTVGYSLPLSGPVAGVVEYDLEGWKARIAAVNAAGGINGVKIKVIYKDDQFTPDKAKANDTEFLQSDHVNSLITFGSGPVGAMVDDQNAACVPLLYPSSAVQEYRDIKEYPWTVQFLPAGDAEARYDISLIKSKFPNGATVGIAENQTASGVGYYEAFKAAAKGTNVKIKVVADSTDPNSAATKIAAAKVDVLYIAGITTDCGPDVQALARIGYTPKLTVNPSNCADATGYIAAGAAANGGVLPSYLKNPADPALANDAGVKEYLSQVTTANKDNAIAVAGWVQADLLINTLKQAAASPDGLSDVGVIEAARDQTYASPMLPNGVTWNSTPTNLIGFSAFQTLVWDSKDKTFHTSGGLIKLSAK